MVVLLTILGTIFLIVSPIFWSEEPKLRTVIIIVASVATILMTLCYVEAVFAQYLFSSIDKAKEAILKVDKSKRITILYE